MNMLYMGCCFPKKIQTEKVESLRERLLRKRYVIDEEFDDLDENLLQDLLTHQGNLVQSYNPYNPFDPHSI
jgi:hypothetical protein